MSAELDAVISGESAAVYAYGIVAGQTTGSARRRALAALAAHERWRDRWSRGSAPAAAVAYDLPFAVTDAASARALAAHVENGLVGPYADLAAASDGQDRLEAVRAAQQCAARAVRWGARTQAFPTANGTIPARSA